jgi:CheY-like chemotaxis protein
MAIVSAKKTKKGLKILYLDDSLTDLENFTFNIKRFRKEVLETDSTVNLSWITTDQQNEALRVLENDDGINCFIADHNMPEKKGLALIRYLKNDYPTLLYVLHTAGGNIDKTISDVCNDENIILSNKSEQFSTLIEKLFEKLSINIVADPLVTVYKSVAADILDDLEALVKEDPTFTITYDDINYTASQIKDEINGRTKFGVNYVLSYIEGLKFFTNK